MQRAARNLLHPQLLQVTGGSGFIGSHLVEDLLSLGYNVHVLDNLETGRSWAHRVPRRWSHAARKATVKLRNSGLVVPTARLAAALAYHPFLACAHSRGLSYAVACRLGASVFLPQLLYTFGSPALFTVLVGTSQLRER